MVNALLLGMKPTPKQAISLPRHPFEAFNLALELIRGLRPVLAKIRRGDKKLAGQIEEAANSIGLNLCEGRRRTGRDKKHFWRIAASSADEVRGGLYLAEAWGHVAPSEVLDSITHADSILAITWKLTN